MDLRPSIVKTLDFLISESPYPLPEAKRIKKLEAWHMCLEDLSDDQIGRGLIEALKDSSGYLLSSGQFRTICLDTHKRFRKNELEKQKVLEYNNPVEPEPVRGQITYAEWKELFIVEEK